MIKGLTTLTFFFTTVLLFAQGEMNNLALETNPFLCKPGVINKSPGKGLLIDYTYNPEFEMRPTDAENASEVRANQRFTSKLKIPIINCQRTKFLIGFKYALERYSFEEIEPENYPLFKRLNETNLKDAEMAAYLIVPINHKYYTSFRVSSSFRGDYSGFVNTSNKYGTYRAAGIFGVKKSDNIEYGIGIYYSKNIRRTRVYPFGFLNWTFNDKWGLESAIPISTKLRRNFKNGNMMLMGVDYSTQSYAVNVEDVSASILPNPSLYHYRRASIEFSLSYLKQFTGWTWMQYKIGYAVNVNSEARDLPERMTYDLRPTGSIVGTVSFFLSPPKKYIK